MEVWPKYTGAPEYHETQENPCAGMGSHCISWRLTYKVKRSKIRPDLLQEYCPTDTPPTPTPNLCGLQRYFLACGFVVRLLEATSQTQCTHMSFILVPAVR